VQAHLREQVPRHRGAATPHDIPHTTTRGEQSSATPKLERLFVSDVAHGLARVAWINALPTLSPPHTLATNKFRQRRRLRIRAFCHSGRGARLPCPPSKNSPGWSPFSGEVVGTGRGMQAPTECGVAGRGGRVLAKAVVGGPRRDRHGQPCRWARPELGARPPINLDGDPSDRNQSCPPALHPRSNPPTTETECRTVHHGALTQRARSQGPRNVSKRRRRPPLAAPASM
jgi:hypothetical protein